MPRLHQAAFLLHQALPLPASALLPERPVFYCFRTGQDFPHTEPHRPDTSASAAQKLLSAVQTSSDFSVSSSNHLQALFLLWKSVLLQMPSASEIHSLFPPADFPHSEAVCVRL